MLVLWLYKINGSWFWHVLKTGFRIGQAGQLPRGLHNQGAYTYSMKKKFVGKNVFVW